MQLSATGRPNEIPFASIDLKKQDYPTNAQNTLTNLEIDRNGPDGFSVEKVTESDKAGGNIVQWL